MNFRNSTLRLLKVATDHFTGAHIGCGEEVRRAMTDVVMGPRLLAPNVIGSSGCIRSNAWICAFSSSDSTTGG
jgi:hypothetical protein